TMDALISVFARIEPQQNFRPGTDEPEDRATADVCVRAIDVIEDEVQIRLWRQVLAVWVGLTGIGWLETGYDPSPIHGTRFLQDDQCMQCGATQKPGQDACEACGGPLQPATDENGAPVGSQVPVGKMYVDVANVFEMFYDYSVPLWHLQRRYIREKAVGLEEAKERWPDIADQITANATENGPQYMLDLPQTAPPIDENQTGRLTATTRGQNNKVTEKWLWQMPNATYPNGLLAI